MADFGPPSPMLPLPDMEPERQNAFMSSLDFSQPPASEPAPARQGNILGLPRIDPTTGPILSEPAPSPVTASLNLPKIDPRTGPVLRQEDFAHPLPGGGDLRARRDQALGLPKSVTVSAGAPAAPAMPSPGDSGFALAPDRPQGAAPAPAAPKPDYGRMMETGKQKTVASTELSPEYKETMAEKDKLGEEQIAAVDKQSEVDKERANILAEGQATLAKLADDWQKEDKRLTAEGDGLARQKAEEHDKLVKERAANSKYTSLTSRLGTGQKIALAIAHMFGGLSQGLTGAKVNPAAEAWRQVVKDDFEIYRQNLQSMDDRVAMARTGMKDAKEAKESMLIDSYRNQEALLRKADADIRKRLAQTGMSEADIAKDARVLAIKADMIEQRQKALEPTLKRIQETTNTARVQNRAAAQGQAQGHFVFDANGKPVAGLADKTQAAKVNAAAKAYRDLRSLAVRYRQNLKEYGAEAWSGSQAAQERASLRAQMTGKYKEAEQLGALDNGVLALARETFGKDPNRLESVMGNHLTGVDAAIEGMDGSFKNTLNSYGLPADSFYTPIAGQQAPSTAGGKRGTYRGQAGTLMPDGTFIPDA